jgi:hypothetical protein
MRRSKAWRLTRVPDPTDSSDNAYPGGARDLSLRRSGPPASIAVDALVSRLARRSVLRRPLGRPDICRLMPASKATNRRFVDRCRTLLPEAQGLCPILNVMRRLFLITFASVMFAACSGAAASRTHLQLQHAVGKNSVLLHLNARHHVSFGPSIAPGADTPPATSAPSLSSEIASAKNGTVIQLAAGSYPEVSDQSPRTGWVTISGQGDASPPQIDGASLWGAQDVRFVDVDFTSTVYINHNPMPTSTEVANNVQILNSTVDCGSTQTTPLTQGIMLRGGSRNVTIAGDLIENCVTGFASVAQDALSENVDITNDTFQNFPGDAIDLGGLDNVTISHNIIHDIADPAHVYHNDGIQFYGNDHDVDITDNVLSDSRNQLIFIQDAIAGTVSHVSSNSDILIAGNLIYGAGSVAVQDQGGIGVRFLNNTMWDNALGSLWLLASPYSGQEPQNTVMINNIIEDFSLFGTAVPTVDSHNLIVNGPSPSYDVLSTDGGCPRVEKDNGMFNSPCPGVHSYTYGAGDLVDVDPSFVDPSGGNFTPGSSSPAVAEGTTAFSTTPDDPLDPDPTALTTDMLGQSFASSVSIGAFQSTTSSVSYGASWNSSAYAPTYGTH